MDARDAHLEREFDLAGSTLPVIGVAAVCGVHGERDMPFAGQ